MPSRARVARIAVAALFAVLAAGVALVVGGCADSGTDAAHTPARTRVDRPARSGAATTSTRPPARARPPARTIRRAPATGAVPRPVPAGAGGGGVRATVTRVVDGDTIHVDVRGFDTTVRLIGIDTPETHHPSKPVQCWGPEAAALTASLLPAGEAVRVEPDPTQDARDRYGRMLAYVYRTNHVGADSVNRALVAAGAARVYVYGGVPTRRLLEALRINAAPSAPTRAGCDPNYTGACVPPYPPDVDCADVGTRVRVVGADPHNLDADGNGIGCESYGD
ncbi:MAG TPA: thermonuclease family protein [Miltoncostaeaceae bacterium]|nr:thermonuclease family protein [Miltoncostaeaceae bacterium]